MSASAKLAGSFRDPSGFVFTHQGTVYRQINSRYAPEYERLLESGLYDELATEGLLVKHEKVSLEGQGDAYAVIRPEQIPLISHPYEWCFSQLRDAALLTLEIQKRAIARGMSLKDASAFNVQFLHGRPVLIDTLSFEIYQEGKPWVAYKQFCQHFLGPLVLMAYVDPRLLRLSREFIDGIPLDLASKLSKSKTRFKVPILLHLHAHAKAHQSFVNADAAPKSQGRQMSRTAMLGLIDSLESTVRGIAWTPAGTEWADYYSSTNYTDDAMKAKRELVASMLDRVPEPVTVWDLGANTGEFSRLASQRNILTVAWDVDEAAVEKNYLAARAAGDRHLLPLVLDLTNPSPALGWAHAERQSVVERGPADVAMALALIHHLAIGNNVPLREVADFLSRCGRWLVIEFVPKEDSQTQRLLVSREDIFEDYHQAGFEAAFGERFDIVDCAPIPGARRTLYLMKTHAA